MKNIIIVITLIFVGQIVGSLFGLIKKPTATILYGSLAFAASMMLGISFLSLIPESVKITSLYFVFLSFIAGMAIMRIVDRTLPHINPELMQKEKPSVEKSVTMLVIGMALHNLPEGLAVGVGFAIDPFFGISIAFGIAIHNIPESIAVIVPLYALTRDKAKSFLITGATAIFELAGFLLGYFLLRGVSLELLGIFLSLAAGFMVYISIDELIPAAQIRQNPKVGFPGVIFGLISVLIIGYFG